MILTRKSSKINLELLARLNTQISFIKLDQHFPGVLLLSNISTKRLLRKFCDVKNTLLEGRAFLSKSPRPGKRFHQKKLIKLPLIKLFKARNLPTINFLEIITKVRPSMHPQKIQ